MTHEMRFGLFLNAGLARKSRSDDVARGVEAALERVLPQVMGGGRGGY